ncbi:MAG TPA: ABC transporter ATP-binding protein [Candidatus Saccharimonadales bacterium]|nr:ABC transporter ATP-binding protein [Candidatus Saccharimonadales bacterium]
MKTTKQPYSLRSFASFAGKHKLRFGITMLSFALANACLAVLPIFIGRLVGALSAHPVQGHQAVIYAWVLIGLSTAHNLLWRGSEILFAKLISPLNFQYEGILFHQIVRKPYGYFIDKFTGKLASYINTISQEQRNLFTDLCFNYTSQFVSLTFFLGILASINWQTAVIFAVGIVGMFLTGRQTIRPSTRTEKAYADVLSTKNAKIIDAIANFVNVKSFHKEAKEIEAVNAEQHRSIKSVEQAQYKGIVFWGSMSFFVRDLIWPAAIGINVYLFLHGELSLADISVVLSTLLIFSNTIWELIWYISQLTLRLARVEEAHQYLFGKTNVTHAYWADSEAEHIVPQLNTELSFAGLSFAYPDKPDDHVLQDLNLRLKQGQKLGIVGKSGSGKSTLTKLLLGYYDTHTGDILIDGKVVEPRDIARIVSYVPQDTSLFHRSIRDNIAYASDRPVDDEAVIAAAKLAHTHEFIKKTDGTYDALVGERGVKLSGGQRQRIAIARAFLDDKPLLILDEATSALDSESELLVQSALESLWEHKTVIAIAHRLSTLRHMDLIAVMDEGKIVELGSHQELLRANGTYAKLWHHQSGGFIEE